MDEALLSYTLCTISSYNLCVRLSLALLDHLVGVVYFYISNRLFDENDQKQILYRIYQNYNWMDWTQIVSNHKYNFA